MFGLGLGRMGLVGDLGFAIRRSLFGRGEQGLWYDLNDDATIFQDSAGTTLATWGDPVGLVLDKHEGLALGANLTASLDLSVAPWSSLGTVSSITASGFSTTGAGGRVHNDILAPDGLYEIRVVYTKTGTNTFSIRTQSSGVDVVSSSAASGTLTGYGFSGSVDQLYFRLSDTGSLTIVSASIRLLAGNHAIQSTGGFRPIRGRMPKRGRVNLLVSTGDVTQAAWTKSEVTATNAFTIVETAASASHVVLQSISIISGQPYTKTLSLQKGVLANAPDVMQLTYGSAGFGATQFATVNVLTGAVVNTAGGATCVALGADPDNAGAWRFRYTATATATTTTSGIGVAFCQNNPTNTRVPSYAGSTTADCRIYKSQSELGSTATNYQHVIDSLGFNVTESGQPSCGYLSYNGSNQWMQTAASVNFSSTDEMSVFAGVRKAADPANAALIEANTPNWTTGSGAFILGAPLTTDAVLRYYAFGSRGSAAAASAVISNTTSASFIAPVYNVITGLADISADQNLLRANGAQVGSATGDQGSGNYGNHTLYFGARAGTSLYFNGLMFSTIIRGALTSGTLLTRTEQYVARQTPTVNL